MVPDVAGSSPVSRPFIIFEKFVSWWDALLLGLIQGLTEFFPVSSSTHLKLVESFLKLPHEGLLFFDLICHLGTLTAALIYFKKDLLLLMRQKEKWFQIFAALLPLIPCYFLFHSFRESANFQGIALLITALLLFFASRTREKIPSMEWKYRDMLFIGAMQGMALLPGISRSGSTISAACFRGWEVKEAVKFSFILMIPTVFGGNLLEGWKALSTPDSLSLPLPVLAIGFFASFGMGMVGVRAMTLFVSKKGLMLFSVYCLVLGLVCIYI